MLYSTSSLAVLGLATLVRSHMIMNTPVPFGKSTLNNSPLLEDGSDFPCKQRTGVYDAEGASNSMALGSTQSLAFTGSATHGGGSCQISVTYDDAPTTSSTWKVIHSIEGGCPIKNVAGNNGDSASAVDPDTYSFTVPTSLPTGTAVLAWTWFNKIGNREMYMNCAPVTLTAASSKRSVEDELTDGNYTMLMERDTTAFNALPDMFVANIPTTSCVTADSQDLAFPDPGDSLDQFGTATATPTAPSGPSCGVKAAATATGAGSSSSAAAATTSAPAQASEASASGGVFITVSPSSSAVLATASPVASSATSATLATVSSAAAASSPVESSVPVASTPVATSSTPASTGTSTGTSGSGSAIAAGTACTTEGEWNCVGGTSFQQCASGTWSVVQELAAGTSCTSGESTNINIVAAAGRKEKRSVRFSGSHLRRHIHKS